MPKDSSLRTTYPGRSHARRRLSLPRWVWHIYYLDAVLVEDREDQTGDPAAVSSTPQSASSARTQPPTPTAPDTASYYVRKVATEVGVDTHLHALRHFAATQMVAGGVDVRIATAAGGVTPIAPRHFGSTCTRCPSRTGRRPSRWGAVFVKPRASAHLFPSLVATAGALVQLAYIRLGGFYLDDIRNLGQAKAGLSLHLLTEPIMGIHFQPGSRFVQWLVAGPFHSDYLAAETILAISSGIAAYLLVRLLDTLFAPRTLHLVVGFLFATSWLLLSTDQWFSGADTVPAVALAVGACLGFCSWLRGGGATPYAAGLLSAAGAVLFWEQALAIPGWLLLIWLCFGRRTERSAREVVLALVPFAGVSLAFLVYVQAQPWHQTLVVPPLSQWPTWFWIPIFHGLVPTLIGSETSSTWRSASVLAASIGIGVLGAWLVARRRFRWSSLVFFVLGTVLVVVPLATARSADGPVLAGITVRYLVFLLFVLAVAVAGAVKGRPASLHARRSMRAMWFGGVSAAILGALYLVNLHATFQANWFNEDSGRAAAGYSEKVGVGLSALGRAQWASVVDSVLPFPVWYSTNDGLNELSSLLPFWSSKVRAVGEGPHLTALDPTGTLRWATFHPGGTGPLEVRVTVSATVPTTMTVRIMAVNSTEPEVPWHIKVGPGTHSFTLPAWSSRVRSVAIHGVRVLSIQTGTVSLESAVVSSRSA